jgi:hypothetical protein
LPPWTGLLVATSMPGAVEHRRGAGHAGIAPFEVDIGRL